MGNSLRLLSKIRRKPSIFTTNLYSQTYDGNVGDLSAEEQKQSNNNLLIALFNYGSRSDEELSIKEDDIVTLVDGSNEHWWEVRRVSDGKTGYVPRKFVTGIKTLEKDDWFFGRISRLEAEHLVSGEDFPIGTFLVRERESSSREYVLTVRSNDEVKNYIINTRNRNKEFFINPKAKFNSLDELINYYTGNTDGLCCRLIFSPPKDILTVEGGSPKTRDNWEISRKQIELIELLGEGNFGKVWKSTWSKKVKDICIKKVDVAVKTIREMSPKAFLDEVKIMKQCDHPHLVKLYAICTEEEPLYIVLEYLKNGSLLSYLRNIENQISEKAMISMSSQIADAMKYLEEQKIVHRDLAARNVLVGENIGEFPFVKVGDFGLARKLIENGMYRVQNERRFPLKWTAPEVNNDGEFTTKSDVWSFGVLLWEIFSHGKEPYAEFDHSQAFKEVKNGHRMSKPEKCPDEVYYEIMLNCWDEDPGKRPRFESLFWYFGNYYVSSQHNDTSIDENVS